MASKGWDRFTPTRVGTSLWNVSVPPVAARFTPTRVGTSNLHRMHRGRHGPVHPHTRGDISTAVLSAALSVHPHTRGDIEPVLTDARSRIRFTPTRVGTSSAGF